MKKISTLLIATVISIASFAGNSTRLTISTVNEQALTLTIDGRSYAIRQNDKNYILNNITPGYHNIRLYSQSIGKRRNNNNQILYNGNVYIKNGYHTDITINRFGKAFVDEQLIGSDNRDNEEQWNSDGQWNNNSSNQAMNNYSFEQLKRTALNEKFDNSRMNIVRSAITNNMFTSAQAKQLIQLFGFDNSRLEVAKLIYKYTIDKNNFTTVFDAFSFSTSKDELANYIRRYR